MDSGCGCFFVPSSALWWVGIFRRFLLCLNHLVPSIIRRDGMLIVPKDRSHVLYCILHCVWASRAVSYPDKWSQNRPSGPKIGHKA